MLKTARGILLLAEIITDLEDTDFEPNTVLSFILHRGMVIFANFIDKELRHTQVINMSHVLLNVH